MIAADADPLTDPIDWRDSGCVNEIYDQGICGACWAFSAAASVATQWCLKTNVLYNLSEQQLVDCQRECDGCIGGWSYIGMDYWRLHYAETAETYPYTAREGAC